MAEAKSGDTVKIHYTGRLEDGTVFDSSRERAPLEFTLGEGQVIPGVEDAVGGMGQGESKTARIPATEAYGPHREELVLVVGPDKFPENVEPDVGQRLQMQQPNGQAVAVTVTDVSDQGIQLDANHPLAGRDLTFDLELVEIG